MTENRQKLISKLREIFPAECRHASRFFDLAHQPQNHNTPKSRFLGSLKPHKFLSENSTQNFVDERVKKFFLFEK